MADALVDRVKQMRAQGYQNSQIIDVLQRDGHSSAEIFDALSHSRIGDAGPQAMPPPPSPANPPPPVVPASPPLTQGTEARPPPNAFMPTPPPPRPDPLTLAEQATRGEAPQAMHHQGHRSSAVGEVSTEEYIEAIIDEKWVELEDDIQKVVDWKNRSEQRLLQIENSMEDLKDRFDKLHAALIGKIESYDKNILEVGAEIKAMEKVFSKVLPVFTDNVKQLDEIADKMKRAV